jgi:GLPGLI family protein
MSNRVKSRLAGKISIALLLQTPWLTMANAQQISAQYAIKITHTITIGEQKTKAVGLDYTGYLYSGGPKNIYFQKPLYLGQYPSGQIVHNVGNNYTIYDVPMDTIQWLGTMNTDSLILRTKSGASGPEQFTLRKFEMGLVLADWTILPETKIINGLQCQRACLYGKSATGAKVANWDVWFCPEIPVQYGPFQLISLPGLIVEVSSEIFPFSAKLTTYTLNTAIPDAVFWPQEFVGAKFTELPPYKKKTTDGKKTKDAVKAEIINQ